MKYLNILEQRPNASFARMTAVWPHSWMEGICNVTGEVGEQVLRRPQRPVKIGESDGLRPPVLVTFVPPSLAEATRRRPFAVPAFSAASRSFSNSKYCSDLRNLKNIRIIKWDSKDAPWVAVLGHQLFNLHLCHVEHVGTEWALLQRCLRLQPSLAVQIHLKITRNNDFKRIRKDLPLSVPTP